MRTEKEWLENSRGLGSPGQSWGDHTILQLLILGEGPVGKHISSSEHCPGVLQHLKEPHLG